MSARRVGSAVVALSCAAAGLILITRSSATAATTPVKFAVIGDFGVDDANEAAVAAVVAANAVDFVVSVGDNQYGTVGYPNAVTKHYGAFIAQSPKRFFPAMGNHDLDDAGAGLAAYLSFFGPDLPGPGVVSSNTSASNRYYDFVRGPVHFFMLDSEPIPATATPNATSAQYLWLQSQMAVSTSPYEIVIVPQNPYSSGSSHAGVGPDGGASLEYLQWPFEAWGATAVFSGDEHNYERIMRDDNGDGRSMPYFVTGNGGRVLNGFDSPAVTGSQVRLAQFGAVVVSDVLG